MKNIKYDYQITTNPHFQDERFGNSPELTTQLESLYIEVLENKNKKIIDKLTKLITQFPKSPQLKNFLSVAYSLQKKHEKAIEVNDWILVEHPDYLFAKINETNNSIKKGLFENVPKILGDSLELKALYPERELFHIAEVTGFLKIVIRYFCAIKDLERAEERFEILKEIDAEHPDTIEAELFIYKLRLNNSNKRGEEEKILRITPTNLKAIPVTKITKPPIFNHSEIENLFKFDLKISADLLTSIIALPRESLIIDLHAVLNDAVSRYDYFIDEGYSENDFAFPLHALLLLKEINATESLDFILEFLSHDYEFLSFWFNDHLTETLWHIIYKLGFNDIDKLKSFLLKPGICTYSKTAVTEALCQMVLLYPDKRTEILNIFAELFDKVSKAKITDNLIDTEFLGLAISDTLDCNFKELLPIIKQLFDKHYVAIGICGNYSSVEKEFNKTRKLKPRNVSDNIIELYNDIFNSWAGYKDDGDNNYNYPYESVIEPAVSNKTNRNDPCICGSGLKYKKCCLSKN
jgi:hypothetical protein